MVGKQGQTKASQLLQYYLPSSESSCILSTGRSALNHLISTIGFAPQDSMLLPAYIAEGVIQPFVKAKIPIKFYKLDSNLFPDFSDISGILEQDNTIKLCVVVHPMGFEAPIDQLVEILKKKRIWLLEDCAQGIFSSYRKDNKPFGGKGNFALYSLNKFIPVLDGAILLSQVKEINVALDQEKLTPLNEKALFSYENHLKINRKIFSHMNQNDTLQLINESSRQYDRYYEYISNDLEKHGISSYSKNILENFNYDMLIMNRRRNTSILYENLSKCKFQFLYENYTKNIIPMAIPATVPIKKRKKWLDKLFRQGIILSLQIDRWDFISNTKDPDRFSQEKNFINSHVLIPINEFLSEENMEYLLNELNAI